VSTPADRIALDADAVAVAAKRVGSHADDVRASRALGRRHKHVDASERPVRIQSSNLPDAFVSTASEGPPLWCAVASFRLEDVHSLEPDTGGGACRMAFDRLLLTATNAPL
jgi:hypothetical protein